MASVRVLRIIVKKFESRFPPKIEINYVKTLLRTSQDSNTTVQAFSQKFACIQSRYRKFSFRFRVLFREQIWMQYFEDINGICDGFI